jgi:iron complex outermembrane receptor protein
MLYTTLSKGFEPGDVAEEFDANGNPYLQAHHPETAWSLETGFKSELNDRTTLNGAAYYTKYNDRLFQTYAFEANQFIQVTNNLGNSRIYGVEAEIATRLGLGFSARAGFGLTKSTWGNIPYYNPDTAASVNLKNNTPPNTPAEGSLSIDWDHRLTDRWRTGAFFSASFTGSQYWDLGDNDKERAYHLLNLGLRLESDSWSYSAIVSNLTNTLHRDAYETGAEIGAPWGVAGIAPPRLWTVRVAYKFNR